MKMKRSIVAVSLGSLVLVMAFAISLMVLPSVATVDYYANNTFEDMALGALTKEANFGTPQPSLASVIDYGGNRVIKLQTVPADSNNTTGAADDNVDKNLRVKGDQIVYSDVESVILQADYFISADAEGTFQSQYLAFDSTEAVSSKSFLDLYKIDLTAGTIHGGTATGSGAVNKGAWNTVTMRLNLKSAAYDLYVNGAVVTSGTLKRGVTPLNLTLKENSWVIAKLNKSCESYAGYILIDNAKILPDTMLEHVYAHQDFEALSVGKFTNLTNVATPSLATVVDDNGSRAVKLQTVPADSSNTTGAADANVDKNIVLPNTAVSYSDADKVYHRVEYYLSDDAEGQVQSQMLSYSYVNESDETVDKNWLSLYYLDLTNAAVRTDYARSASDVLKRGAWNSVTTVLDLDTGAIDIYVNERYVFSDNVGRQKLTLKANAWIVAKLNKGCASYAGYIMIDNATFATFNEETCTYSPAMTDANGNKLWYVNVTNSAGTTEKVTDNVEKMFRAVGTSYEAVYFDTSAYRTVVAPVKGASIRLSHAAGIRFATQLDLDVLNELLALKKDGQIADVAIGTVIAPKSYVDTAQVFTMEGLDSALPGSNSKYLNVKGSVGHYYGALPGVVLNDGYDTCFVGSITNVKLGNRALDFSAIGYVQVKLHNGESVYLYSYEYDAATLPDYSRSVQGIAATALSDASVQWSEKELVILNGLANGATALPLSSSVLTDVQYTANEFFFRNAAGMYCRLTYEGANGWRLQANGESYDGFDETGAGQALSIYLGEAVLDKTEQLVVTKDASAVKVASPSTGTYVTLNYADAFNMQFHTAEGTVVSNVNAISIDNTSTAISSATVTLSGTLASGEAVYGGGERFDVVNRRGTAIDLYTADGWNNAGTTYMAIPLFVTSRGAGMFVNRYENMSADFGAADANGWSIAIKNEMIDCYFYATGRISDALFGYTEISGHSSLPEEWAQGELICRYSPDLSTFEDRTEYTVGYAKAADIPASELAARGVKAKAYSKYTEIPNYGSYYVKGSLTGTVKQISSLSSVIGYDTATLYADEAASTVAYGTVSKKLYALGKTWATYDEAVAFGVSEAYDWAFIMKLKTASDGTATGLSNYAQCYYLAEDGMYYKAGAKGNPAGHGVKTIVTNLINAGMKPTAMVMEPFGWGNISTNAEKREELKMTVEWLDSLGIKSMFYMGVGSLSGNMDGYKPEYQVWATLTDSDGNVTKTYKIPKTSGTGTNPDVGTSSTQQYLDVTNPEAVDWYMNEIWGMMIDFGADGIKIDFCECMPNEGNYTAYDLEYNFYDDSVFDGDDIHHAYSTYFISLFYKSMLEQKEAKNIPDGFVVLSRGGGIGSQRNPYLWEGDQARTFEKIEDQLIALINSGISGVPFMTYDLAGYAYSSSGAQITGAVTLEAESEIFARAIEYTAFTSNIQSHGDVRHAYQMTEEVQEIYRNYTDLHEQLIPYIQKYSQVACDTGIPVVRHMILQYQDDANVYDLETQYMFGDALLVAPVTTGSTTTKSVYLPEGTWMNLLTGETVNGGQTLTVNATLSQLPVFLNVDCTEDDQNLLAPVFNGETWKAISGVQLELEQTVIKGDPWLEDVFED